MQRCGYLELHEHAGRVVGSHIGAHSKDAGLVEGCPQLASATCDTCQLGVSLGGSGHRGEACWGRKEGGGASGCRRLSSLTGCWLSLQHQDMSYIISGAVSCNVKPSPTAPSLVYWLKPKHTLCISVLNSV